MAGGYYLAPALVQLRNEINAEHPERDKSSDGWIGDPSHAARVSDHNPDWPDGGVVRALDVDKDGVDTNKLLAIAIRDPRIEYVIWNGFIYRRATGFKKEVYTGSNKHTGHMHLSSRHGKGYEDDTRAWGYASAAPASTPPAGQVSLQEIASQVRAGHWGNGDERKRRLAAAGYDYNAVQAIINGGTAAAPAPARKSVDEIAAEVIAGAWGNNPERSRRLVAAGYSSAEVQAAVNAKMGGGGAPAVSRPSIGVIAQQVINGQWGNGPERQRRLASAGYNYAEIQTEVNRRLRG